MAKKIEELTKDTMEEAVAQGVTMVDFWADWCGPCKLVAPILEDLFESRDDFKLAKVDCDAEPELAEGFGIQGIPTVILFRNGKAELAAVGARDREFYEEMLTELTAMTEKTEEAGT